MANSPREFRIEALLDFSRRLPPPPDGVSELERVHECQTPFFVAVDIADDSTVQLVFDAPAESPTVRGFAGILREGLDGEKAEVILGVPDDFFYEMGLEEVVTPLRLRGMGAILGRIKTRITEQL